MVDPKESPEIPTSADSEHSLNSAGSTKPGRDPELEALLRSHSSDDDEGLPKSTRRGAPKKGAKRTKLKTGTSLDRKSRKSRLPIIAGLVGALVLLGGGGTALFTTLHPAQSQATDKNSDKTQKIGTKQADPAEEKDATFNTQKGVFPIPLAPWQQQDGTQGLSPEGRTELLATYLGSGLESSAGILPSEAAGFTSDDSKILNDDGSLNSSYSFWTQESFTADAGQIIEKFLNPSFGNWAKYQGTGFNPNSIDPATLFPGTFTDDLLKNGGPVVKWLPINADWAQNNYGRSDLSATGAKWYGQITSSTSDFTFDDETSQYTVNFSADVKFTAYSSDGEKVSENGKLTLEFVANPGSERGPGGKVLVNKSSLTIGG